MYNGFVLEQKKMIKKLFPAALVSFALLAACGDDSSSAADETVASSSSGTPASHEVAKGSCSRKKLESPASKINVEYRVEDESATFNVTIDYEDGTSVSYAVDFCKRFAEKYGFTELKCEPEDGKAYSEISLKKEMTLRSAMEFMATLCNSKPAE